MCVKYVLFCCIAYIADIIAFVDVEEDDDDDECGLLEHTTHADSSHYVAFNFLWYFNVKIIMVSPNSCNMEATIYFFFASQRVVQMHLCVII